MSILSSSENPISSISREQALDHWRTGNGAPVFVDRSSHMEHGGGSVFSIRSFSEDIFRVRMH